MREGNTNGFKKVFIPWNKGKIVPSVSEKMKGNKNGQGNKGRVFSPETLLKMRLAKLGKPSKRKKIKVAPIPKVRILMSPEEKRRKQKEKNKRWLSLNYEKKLWFNNQRRVKRMGNGGSHSFGEWENLKAQYNWTCPACKKNEPAIKLTRDHIVPLSKGGSDNIENIQPLCGSCNCRKNARNIRF